MPPKWQNTSLVLYHGTLRKHAQNIQQRIDLSKCRPGTDFGRGFYTTTILRQAKGWAWKIYALLSDAERQLNENEPVVIQFEVDREELAQLKNLGFVDPRYEAEDLWSLIFRCRQQLNNGHERRYPNTAFYDVVYRPVADFWWLRSTVRDADQISFHTDAGVDLLQKSIQQTLIVVR